MSRARRSVEIVLMGIGVVLTAALAAGSMRLIVIMLSRPLVQADRIDRVDAVVVLGQGSHRDGTPSPETAYGLIHGARLLRAGVAGTLVLSGGTHRGTAVTDADAMAETARLFGIPTEALVLERGPSSTVEHARAVATLAPRLGVRSVAVVTTPLRSRRAVLAFRRAGLDALGAPGVSQDELPLALFAGRDDPFGRLGVTAAAISEHLTLALYRLRGWI